MLRIRRNLVASLVSRVDTVLAHQSLNSLFAGREPPISKLLDGFYVPDLLSTFSQLRPLVQRQLLKFFPQSVEFSNSYHSIYPTDFYTITIDHDLVVT